MIPEQLGPNNSMRVRGDFCQEFFLFCFRAKLQKPALSTQTILAADGCQFFQGGSTN
jgi:hypothetical protein